jgi:GT2 family glycosyltransferase
MKYHPLVLTYNNKQVLEGTLSRLFASGFDPKTITVIENGSNEEVKRHNVCLCCEFGVALYDIADNRGWGGAINCYLDTTEFSEDHVLIIMAHDCYFQSLDLDEVTCFFENPRVVFVYPQYPHPVICYYTILSSFKIRKGLARGYVRIGNHTALFARASTLKKHLRYDEEFHVYGGEFEIFMQASDLGFKTASAHRSIIINPSTDAPSAYGYISHKINSIYYAYKRYSFIGFAIRYLIVFSTLLNELFKSGPNSPNFIACRNALLFALSNPGCGMRSYLSSSNQRYLSYKP